MARQERSPHINIIPFPGGNGGPEARLEAVEEKVHQGLRQASSPLVPVRVLAEYCGRGEAGIEIGTAELLQFLRSHDQVQVIEGPAETEPVPPGMFEEAGIEMGPRAILKERMPNMQELARLMGDQLNAMARTLEKALNEAAEQGDDGACERLRDALQRTHTLRAKMERFLS